MARRRRIPEDRIKLLTASASVARRGADDEEWMDRWPLEDAGRAVAEKLFEFKKVLVVHNVDSHRMEARASIDVIIPDGPPSEVA